MFPSFTCFIIPPEFHNPEAFQDFIQCYQNSIPRENQNVLDFQNRLLSKKENIFFFIILLHQYIIGQIQLPDVINHIKFICFYIGQIFQDPGFLNHLGKETFSDEHIKFIINDLFFILNHLQLDNPQLELIISTLETYPIIKKMSPVFFSSCEFLANNFRQSQSPLSLSFIFKSFHIYITHNSLSQKQLREFNCFLNNVLQNFINNVELCKEYIIPIRFFFENYGLYLYRLFDAGEYDFISLDFAIHILKLNQIDSNLTNSVLIFLLDSIFNANIYIDNNNTNDIKEKIFQYYFYILLEISNFQEIFKPTLQKILNILFCHFDFLELKSVFNNPIIINNIIHILIQSSDIEENDIDEPATWYYRTFEFLENDNSIRYFVKKAISILVSNKDFNFLFLDYINQLLNENPNYFTTACYTFSFYIMSISTHQFDKKIKEIISQIFQTFYKVNMSQLNIIIFGFFLSNSIPFLDENQYNDVRNLISNFLHYNMADKYEIMFTIGCRIFLNMLDSDYFENNELVQQYFIIIYQNENFCLSSDFIKIISNASFINEEIINNILSKIINLMDHYMQYSLDDAKNQEILSVLEEKITELIEILSTLIDQNEKMINDENCYEQINKIITKLTDLNCERQNNTFFPSFNILFASIFKSSNNPSLSFVFWQKQIQKTAELVGIDSYGEWTCPLSELISICPNKISNLFAAQIFEYSRKLITSHCSEYIEDRSHHISLLSRILQLRHTVQYEYSEIDNLTFFFEYIFQFSNNELLEGQLILNNIIKMIGYLSFLVYACSYERFQYITQNLIQNFNDKGLNIVVDFKIESIISFLKLFYHQGIIRSQSIRYLLACVINLYLKGNKNDQELMKIQYECINNTISSYNPNIDYYINEKDDYFERNIKFPIESTFFIENFVEDDI